MIYERSCHKTSDYTVSNVGVINERWQGSEIETSATIREFASRDSENLQQTCRSVVFPAKTAKSYEAVEVYNTLS